MRNKRQLWLAVGVALALALAVAGGVAWRQVRDRDARCERDFYALEAAVKANARGEGAPASSDLQASVEQCMDDGWKLDS